MYEYDNDFDARVVKKTYLRLTTTLRLGEKIKKSILERKNFKGEELVGGRLLTDQAKLTLKNMRKTYAIAEKYMNKDGQPKLSGWSEEQVTTAILTDFWKAESY